MGKWDEYQDFSTNAKPHGGVNAYLSFLENNAKEEGREEGIIEGGIYGVIGTLIVSGIVGGGVWAIGKAKNYFYERKQRNKNASVVRQEFLNNVEQHEAQENSTSTEN